MTPNEVKQKRKTIAAAAASDGPSSGSVIVRARRSGGAPSIVAASISRRSSADQAVPTRRTTTATLKNTWARRIAHDRALDAVGQERDEGRCDHDGGEDERDEHERLDERSAPERPA